MEAASAPTLDKPMDSRYPKAKFAKTDAEGDLKSPAYDKIKNVNGEAQRIVENHPYVTQLVRSAKEEKELGPEWVDHPSQLK